MKYYLAIDVGTTNWKAAIYNETGVMQGIERLPTPTHTDAQGNRYYDPHEMWREIQALCRAVTAKVAQPISGVSVTSIAEAVVGIDKDGNTVGDIITWFDTRSFAQAKRMEEQFGKERLYSITGLDVNPIFSLPKILWVRENQPEQYAKTVKWLQMTDYMLFCLTGECVTDYTLASRTLAFDVKENVWSHEILDAVNVPVDVMPTVLESGTVIGKISASISACTGITQGAVVAVGGNDHPCASIAAGVMNGGTKILDSSGTAESFIYISQKGAVPNMVFEGQRTCRYLQKDRFALWGGIICSGRSFDWAYETFTSSKEFGIDQADYHIGEIIPQLADVKGMEDGLIFYPHLRGAGAPYWNPKISGSFLGLRDTHTGKAMMRSVLEGLSMQAKVIADMQQKVAGVEADSLCVVGGSSKNIVWQTIKANVLQKKIELCHEPEATSLGAAMLAAIGDGTYANLEEASLALQAKNQIIEPDPAQAAKYQTLYELYCEGYEHLNAFNEKLYETLRR